MIKLRTITTNGNEVTEVDTEFPTASRGEMMRTRSASAKRGSYARGIHQFGDRRLGPDKLELMFDTSSWSDENYQLERERIMAFLNQSPLWLVEGGRRCELVLGDKYNEKPLIAHYAQKGHSTVMMDVFSPWEDEQPTELSEALSDGENSFSFTNNGSLSVYPILDFDTPGVTELIIDVDGRLFTFEDSAGMLSGVGLRINTLLGTVTRGGIEVGDESGKVLDGSQMPTFPPGTTDYIISLTGGSGPLTITYREAYL